MPEVRTFREGELRFVQASGSGRAWATGATPVSGIFAYVQSFSYTSARAVTTIMERGIPDHHKETEKSPIDVTFQVLWANTGQIASAASAAGATMPMVHFEYRASAQEVGAGSGYYIQFHGNALKDLKFGEAKEGSTFDVSTVALGMNGPTASGFLS